MKRPPPPAGVGRLVHDHVASPVAAERPRRGETCRPGADDVDDSALHDPPARVSGPRPAAPNQGAKLGRCVADDRKGTERETSVFRRAGAPLERTGHGLDTAPKMSD